MIPTIKLLVIAILLVLVAGSIGFAYGFERGAETTIKKALTILPFFVNMSINYEHVQQALFQYENRIGGCIPTKI